MIPPIGPQSRLPVFHEVFADIGDRQSIAASLSTFSAHVAAVRDILERAGPTSLVLLDEIGSGTDPAEGAALAAATLKALTRRHVVTLATTHLGALKKLAAETVGIVNASLQFDAETLTPTYRLLKGVPGRSYGLAIARQLGVPADVLREAEGAALGQARAAVDEATAKQARRMVEEAIEKTKDGGQAVGRSGGQLTINVGDHVQISDRTAGTVVEVRDNGEIVVQTGSVRLVVDVSQVQPTARPPDRPTAA